MDEFKKGTLCQLHQWNLWQRELELDGSNTTVRMPSSLEERCRDAFASQETRSSAFQNDVVAALESMGLDPKEEVLMTKTRYRLDAVVEVPKDDGSGGSSANKVIGIEADGPSHFMDRQPTGSTLLKRRQVTRLDGIHVASIPYWEWQEHGKDVDKKQQYLRALLGL